MNHLRQQGIAALKSGDKEKARRILVRVVKENPKDEKAWLWLSGAVEEEKQRLACLKKVLEINPRNEHAKRGISNLQKKRKIPSKEASQVVQEPDTPVTLQNEKGNFKDSSPERERKALLEKEIERLTSEGWAVVSQTDSSAQLRKDKQWNQTGLIVFVLLPLLGGCLFPALFGLALIGLLFVTIDYLLAKPKLKYVNIDQLEQRIKTVQGSSTNSAASEKKDNKKPTDKFTLVVAGIGLFFICIAGLAIIGNVFINEAATSTSSNGPVSGANRTVTTPNGTFSIPGTGYIDGRDTEAAVPLTLMEVRVWDDVDLMRRPVCKLSHGTEVNILDFKQDPDVSSQWYHFQVQSGSCKGWLTWWFVNTDRFEPVGERIYDS